MINMPEKYSPSPYAPKDAPGKPGAIMYSTEYSNNDTAHGRKNAFKQMFEACGSADYKIMSEERRAYDVLFTFTCDQPSKQ